MFQFQLAIEARAFMLLFSLFAFKCTVKNWVFLIQCSITNILGFENRIIINFKYTKLACCSEFIKNFLLLFINCVILKSHNPILD